MYLYRFFSTLLPSLFSTFLAFIPLSCLADSSLCLSSSSAPLHNSSDTCATQKQGELLLHNLFSSLPFSSLLFSPLPRVSQPGDDSKRASFSSFFCVFLFLFFCGCCFPCPILSRIWDPSDERGERKRGREMAAARVPWGVLGFSSLALIVVCQI